MRTNALLASLLVALLACPQQARASKVGITLSGGVTALGTAGDGAISMWSVWIPLGLGLSGFIWDGWALTGHLVGYAAMSPSEKYESVTRTLPGLEATLHRYWDISDLFPYGIHRLVVSGGIFAGFVDTDYEYEYDISHQSAPSLGLMGALGLEHLLGNDPRSSYLPWTGVALRVHAFANGIPMVDVFLYFNFEMWMNNTPPTITPVAPSPGLPPQTLPSAPVVGTEGTEP